ncbi:MAG: 2-oxoacid:acceptor oxidoreductase family protein, partial [Acidobacteria bacterium]|nr:2-oxoacid:acceptor oxidoreductase family protein [Acidobacteriota bacterium]
PASVQEMADLTILAFELADRYRNPAVVVADGFVGQMMETLELHPHIQRAPEKPWAIHADAKTRPNLITSIQLEPDALEAHVRKLEAKYKEAAAREPRHELYRTEDAEILLVGYGIVSRVLRTTVDHLRRDGIRAGLFRPITLWPFPGQALLDAARHSHMVLVVEMSTGQMVEDVRLALNSYVPVDFYSRVGCPGCGHGIAHKLIAEAVADMGMQDRSVFVSPVGCSVFAYYYFDVGNVQAAHGRTPAVATALKRSLPRSLVIAYQGDGDLAAIGTAEIIHAANRGENITVFFVNNAIYGMTGGQMAPTTLVGQSSTTSPWGRRPSNEGYPLHVSELLATLEAPVYIERVALSDNKNIMKARKAIRKALDLQRTGAGFSLVEILSPCPTIWKLNPVEAQRWVAEKMIPVFPLGVFRDRKPNASSEGGPPLRSVSEVLALSKNVDEPEESNPAVAPHTVDLQIKVAGFGGQGVLLLGEVIAHIGMQEGLQVSWLPSYGPEMRSGSAHCHVCLSRERIGSPLVEHPHVMIAMNEISLRKFAEQVAPEGVVLYNRAEPPSGFALAHGRLLCVPASDIADQLGNAKVANMVMLGALAEVTGAFTMQNAMAVLERKVKNNKLLDADCQAFTAGQEWICKHSGVEVEEAALLPS